MSKLCSIVGCERPSTGRGWCSMHYQRWRSQGDPLARVQRKRPKPRTETCTLEGCDKAYLARGMCGMHYKRWRQHGSPFVVPPKPKHLGPPPRERFRAKVEKRGPDDCWEFQGKCDRDGYGRFHLDGKTRGAHVVAWTFANGRVPAGLCVLHHCDNPSCCNPVHLFLGTIGDNNRDRATKGRSRPPRDREQWRQNVSRSQRGRPLNHKVGCTCLVCAGRGRLCSIDGCDQPHVARSYCAKHYKRWEVHGDPYHA